MSGDRNVDALWQALKSQQGPAKRASLSGFAGLPGVTSQVRTYDKSRGPAPQQVRPSFIAQLGEAGRSQEQQQQQAAADHHALLATLQRDINGLSDPDRTVRRRAVEKLHAALLGSSSTPPEALQAAVAGPLLVPLVRLLADPAEKCRELAVAFLAHALQRLPQPAALLPTLVPALQERVGSVPPQEPSEEIRLALAELVAGPLLAHPSRPLPEDLMTPLCATLCCQLQDPYSDIKKAACTAIASLLRLIPPSTLPPGLQQPLVLALAANLAHQHSRVRLASLQALHALVQHGMPIAVMQEVVLPAVRPLAYDHAPAIRAALFSSAAHWAGSQQPAEGGADDDGRAGNQCCAFLPLLLPLVLLGLTDEVEATRSDTYQQLEAIAVRITDQADASEGDMALDQHQQLPGYCHPFSAGRPSLATRRLVQSQLSRLLQQCLAELREWTATLRASAARLLRTTLIGGEAEVAPQLPAIILALRAAVADDDAGVATHAVCCVHVLGVNLPARQWMPLAAEAVAAEQQTAAQRTAGLVVLSALLYAAARSGSVVDSDCLRLAAATLSSSQLASAAVAPDGAPLRQQLLAVCSNLLQWAGTGSTAVAAQLFQLLLQLWTVELDSQSDAAAGGTAGASSMASPTAAVVLAQLATLGRASPADLCDQYGAAMVKQCIKGHAQWTHAHPDWRMLAALLRLCGGSALLQLWPVVLPAVQQIAADHERDPRLRMELLQLATALLADNRKADAWQQAAAGQQLVRGVLLPALIWRAGRVPAAVRYAGLTALATLLAQQRLPAAQLLQLADEGAGAEPAAAESSKAAAAAGGLLVQLLISCMEEEYEPDTRQLACHAVQLLLEAVGPQLGAQQLSALQPDLLRRLDDSSNSVRVAACAALQPWLQSLLAAPDGVAAADAAASSLASSMLIHVEDPDVEVARAVCAVLEQLAAAKPAAVQPLAQAAAGQQHVHPALWARVLAACSSARR